MNTEHLVALLTRLSSERERFAQDGSELRAVWISQIEREIEQEKKFLGITDDLPQMSTDEILSALES